MISDHDLENVVEMLDEDEDITDLTRPSTTPQSTKDYFEKSQVRHTLSVLTYPSITYPYQKTLNGNIYPFESCITCHFNWTFKLTT